MRVVYCTLAVLLFVGSTTQAQRRLYTSKSYSLTSDSVTERNFTATAASRVELRSNYQSQYRRNTERTITFKFSLNGSDNERMPGQDHHLTVVRQDHGKYVSPIFAFGASDPAAAAAATDVAGDEKYLTEDTDVQFRVDMRRVLNDFKTKGFFVTVTGEKILAADLKNISIAGATFPLTWNFPALPSQHEFTLADPDSDGIYNVTVHFRKETYPGRFADSIRTWKLTQDISMYPHYESPDLLVDALYNKALEELRMDLRSDGAFMAGEMWPGVWTRDVSYSILLSLAAIAPDASKTTLLAKVKNRRIIQDTGTGGSWPVSSDRTVWALAAWEIFAVTGDRDWLKKAYEIVKNSAEDDLAVVCDVKTGLFLGESSFLDWREQTYPRWMDPKDIYASRNLGTNAVHYQTYRTLARMASILGEDGSRYARVADNIKQGMNTRLWMQDRGYYGQYLYGRNSSLLSPRSEGLGEALAVLFDIADARRQQEIIAKTPVTPFGIPCIAPQIPDIPPYHNDAVWPFVEAFWGWASAKAGNTASVNGALASVYRAAAFYLTNKENLVSSTGDFMGTEINSNRQLWSVAGNLAMTYRIIFGMSFTPDALVLHPFIPKEYAGNRTLRNFAYRKAKLDITIRGYGSGVRSVTLNGKKLREPIIPGTLTGPHAIVITMNSRLPAYASVAMAGTSFSPETPSVSLGDSLMHWTSVPHAVRYRIVTDGKIIGDTQDTTYRIAASELPRELQVEAVDQAGVTSFASEPLFICPSARVTSIPAKSESNEPVRLEKDSTGTFTCQFTVPSSGSYTIDVRYANGNGPINTDNKCAIRTMLIDGVKIGSIVMPQRGEGKWEEWGYSNALLTDIASGIHTVTLEYRPYDANMNGAINTALVKEFRCTLLHETGPSQ
jgi:hypothetical protein